MNQVLEDDHIQFGTVIPALVFLQHIRLWFNLSRFQTAEGQAVEHQKIIDFLTTKR